MLLEGKNAVVYGGGGSIGGAVARAFAREGARVFLAGRTQASLDAVADDIRSAGGAAETAQLDALDEAAVDAHADAIAAEAGSIDVSFNAILNDDIQGVPLSAMPYDDFFRPIAKAMRNQFLTTRAVARHMAAHGSGVILTVAGPGHVPGPVMGGTIPTWAAIEALSRQWASELGPQGIRVLWLRVTGVPETLTDERIAAVAPGMPPVEQIVAGMNEATMLKRAATLAEVGNAAAFVASDHASAMTATLVNLSAGMVLE